MPSSSITDGTPPSQSGTSHRQPVPMVGKLISSSPPQIMLMLSPIPLATRYHSKIIILGCRSQVGSNLILCFSRHGPMVKCLRLQT